MVFAQIYNENIRDLLNTSNTFLELREDPQGGNQVLGLTELQVTNSAEVRIKKLDSNDIEIFSFAKCRKWEETHTNHPRLITLH